MSDSPLTGIGVLVTRPEHQSQELKNAIVAAGGRAIMFPVIEIERRTSGEIANDLKTLPDPTIVLFVSANAVNYGLEHIRTDNLMTGAVGPATVRALEAGGVRVDISATGGFDSEQLLATDALTDVAGKALLIVRGSSGRELLADTLRERGATVDYLSVYARKTRRPSPGDLDRLEEVWRGGGIDAVMVMSVASLDSMLEILPAYCIERLRATRLVAPSTRVIQTALERIPGQSSILASGPGALDMTGALIASLQADSDTDNGE